MHKVSFRHACELLAKQHPALAAAASTSTPAAAVKLSQGKLRTAQSFSLGAGDQELLDQVIDFYHTTLKSSPEALEYLENRGLGSMELIEHFRLGYANRTLAYRLAPKQYKAGAEMRTALQRVGILRDSGHEHFNGSIVVPLFGSDGNDPTARPVVGAYARKLLDNLRAGTPKHLYLPGPHRGVFNREGLEGQSEIILCEALIDALTFWAAGYRNVTSCYGVNGLTDELLAALKSSGAQRILIAFDRDEAGDRGAEALAKRLTAEGLDCFRLLFPKGMDANAYACAVKPAEKSLGVVIRSAQWLGQGAKPASTHAVSVVDAVTEPRRSRTDTAEQGVAVETVLPLAASSCAAPDGGRRDGIHRRPYRSRPPRRCRSRRTPEPQPQADERQVTAHLRRSSLSGAGVADAVDRSAQGQRAGDVDRCLCGREIRGAGRRRAARRYAGSLSGEAAPGVRQERRRGARGGGTDHPARSRPAAVEARAGHRGTREGGRVAGGGACGDDGSADPRGACVPAR